MKARVIVALLIAAFSASALAQRPGLIIGAGAFTCGEYLEDRKHNRHNDHYSDWVVGYLSAYNAFSAHPQIDIPKQVTIHAYLEKHCRDYPLHYVVQAVNALIGELGGVRPPATVN